MGERKGVLDVISRLVAVGAYSVMIDKNFGSSLSHTRTHVGIESRLKGGRSVPVHGNYIKHSFKSMNSVK